MSRLSNIVVASEALAALTPEDRALAIEAGATRRRRRGGAKPGPKPGSKKTAPTPAKKSTKKPSSEAKAEKAKRLISEGS